MKLRAYISGCVIIVGVLSMGTFVPVAAGAARTSAAPPEAKPVTGSRTVTLITGDRVVMTGRDAKNVAIRPGQGRANMSFATQRHGGNQFVIPSDALRLVQSGRLDRRLFDVTALVEYGYDDRRKELPVIVTYADGARTKAGADSWSGARTARALPSVNGQAVGVRRSEPGAFWRALAVGSGRARSLSSGVSKVWLDGVLKPTLDDSVPQIGAPAAWQAGFTGAGVTVALLDSGVDATHPDLASQVTGAKNFTEGDGAEDGRDYLGHGTHVASTIAGSGAASSGRYKGVATGAKLLDGKVCAQWGCPESWILAGMEWAAQNAKVINMSLGGRDTPEVDPLEQAVNTLTAQRNVLFVISAGNSGPDAASVGQPGSADAALTVGAVDKADKLAAFSSRGPRVGDSAIKPDITAPGVAIKAARSKDMYEDPGQSYTELSGTSMAAPHVAGSAAILAQQHPTWTPDRLKSTLMGSAKPSAGAGVFDQGAGRVAVDAAITQNISATPASVSFGLQFFPHGDDKPVTKTVTYRNDGSSAVTLNLALKTAWADGTPTQAGMFKLDASTVAVPAGGTADVKVTVDTSVPSQNGTPGGYLTATAGTQVVQTPVGVDKEIEKYNLTLIHKDRAGQPTADYATTLWEDVTGPQNVPIEADGQVVVRLPKDEYLLASFLSAGDVARPEITQMVQPVVSLTRNMTVVLDASKAKPVAITVPEPKAKRQFMFVGVDHGRSHDRFESRMWVGGSGKAFTGELGSTPMPGMLSLIQDEWANPGADGSFDNSPFVYSVAWHKKGRFWTGFKRDVTKRELATVQASYGKHASDRGRTYISAEPPGSDYVAGDGILEFSLPFRRTEYYNTDGGVLWTHGFSELKPDPEYGYLPFSDSFSSEVSYRSGKVYPARWNTAVFGPAFPGWPARGVTRTGDVIEVSIEQFSDDADHWTYREVPKEGEIRLFRNGKLLAETPSPGGQFTVPSSAATYRAETVIRHGAPFTLSTRQETAWTFKSGYVAGTTPTPLPVSVLRFTPPVNGFNTAPAGKRFDVPITVHRQPGSKAAANKTLTVDVSYDDGATWQKASVTRAADGTWTAHLQHPAKAGYVSLRAAATDAAGNTVRQTIIHAYRIAP